MTEQQVPYSDSSHTYILTWHIENKDFPIKLSRPAFQKEFTFKHGGAKNYELLTSLANNFHLCKTKQSKITGEKNPPIHIYKNCTRHLLVCTWTRLWICFGWKVYWKHSPCTYTYIHISRAMKLSDVANICFLPFRTVIVFLLRLMSGPSAPTPYSPVMASLKPSSWLYF